ncbi:MAG: hypothetical protein U0359_02615 [Byssovorax sp.]
MLGRQHLRRGRQPDDHPDQHRRRHHRLRGAGTSHTCNGCVATTCAAQGVTAGNIADGCGGTLYCGPAALPRVTSGYYFSCAIESGGTVRCWGYNANGQLGDGTTTTRYEPAPVPA